MMHWIGGYPWRSLPNGSIAIRCQLIGFVVLAQWRLQRLGVTIAHLADVGQ